LIMWKLRRFCAAILFVAAMSVAPLAGAEWGEADEEVGDAGSNNWGTEEVDKSRMYLLNDEVYGKDNKPKYAWLMDDTSYRYYVDAENLKWMRVPYRADEYMIDVWVLLTSIDPSVPDHYPEKYFLEHYYLWPKNRKVQFLSEVEVHGRPQNLVSEREYNVKNWENLIPGSMEDRIYSNLLKLMKETGVGGSTPPRDSFRDMLEEYLRISL